MTIYVSDYLVERTVRKQSFGFSFLVKDPPTTVQHSLDAVLRHALCVACFVSCNRPSWLSKLCFKDGVLDYLMEMYITSVIT